jgi:hypothetical protein
MPRQTETINFSVSPVMLREVERIARAERRPGKSVFRDMVNAYKARRQPSAAMVEPWVEEVIREAKEEQKKQPLSTDDLAAQLKTFARDFSKRAKARGIAAKDIDRLIHDVRRS